MNSGPLVLVMFMAFAGVSLVGPNPLLGFMSASVLALVLGLLWRPDVSPVFVVVCAMQWLQSSAILLYSKVLGIPVEQAAAYGGNISTAIALSLASVATLAVGYRLGLGATSWLSAGEVERDVKARTEFYWPRAYAWMFGVGFVAERVAYIYPGLTQLVLAVAGLKWAYFFIFTVAASQSNGSVRWLWVLALAVELALGSVGYLSAFRTALFYTLLGYMAVGTHINWKRMVALTGGVATIILLGTAWTAIKMEQRAYYVAAMYEGVAPSDLGSRLQYTVNLIERLDADQLANAAHVLMERVSYVGFFAQVLVVVPAEVPHEKGALWMDAVVRPFMPRLLFPNKSVIDDSEATRRYSGINVAGIEEATTITIGYPAESYVDFGPWLMMFPIGVLGWAIARFYRWAINFRHCRGIVGEALATVVVFQTLFLETSLAKMIGALALAMLVSWIMARWILPAIDKRAHA